MKQAVVIDEFFDLERVKGIEPSSQAWEAHILPLNHTRNPVEHLFIYQNLSGKQMPFTADEPAKNPSALRQALALGVGERGRDVRAVIIHHEKLQGRSWRTRVRHRTVMPPGMRTIRSRSKIRIKIRIG